MPFKLICTLLFVIVELSCFNTIHCHKSSNKRLLLREISALTFYATNTLSDNSGPELVCIGGNAHDHKEYHPSAAQCYNRGFDGQDVQWECKAEMDNRVHFGRTYVSCKGFSHPDDPYVRAGSCGLQYELNFKRSKSKGAAVLNRIYERLPGIPSSWLPYSPFIVLFTSAFLIWYFCLSRVTRSSDQYPPGPIGFDYAGAAEPSAPPPPPEVRPPSYEEATRPPRYPFGFGDDSATTTTRRQHRPETPEYGFPFFRPRKTQPVQPETHTFTETPSAGTRTQTAQESSISSWLPLGAAVGAGLLGGYLFGSSGSSSRSSTRANTSQQRRNIYPNLGLQTGDSDSDEGTGWINSSRAGGGHRRSSGSSNDRHVSTSFARTIRR